MTKPKTKKKTKKNKKQSGKKKHMAPTSEKPASENMPPAVIHPVEIPIETSTVKEGTANVEPQFIVLRYGQKFVTATSYKELHKGLLQAEEMEEQIVEINFKMEGYPLDCIVQVNEAINIAYGFSHAKDRMTFFGPRPPQRLNIKTGLDTSVHVVYGAMAPPAWEGGFITIHVDATDPLSLAITGQIKRKFEPEIKKIVMLAEKLLSERSIYRGQAVELDLGYVIADPNDDTKSFNPSRCAPKFIDVSKTVSLILPRDIEMELNNNVWNIIKHPEYFRVNDVPIKGGVLLDGPPGTGKTLTAYTTAQTSVENKWTYIYLRTPLTAETFLVGYRLAQLYGPSVFFVEDCDVLFGKDRDEDMNKLLETLDGITAKTAEVITIFTTNFPDKLNPAFTRSGRINHQISFRAPDAEAAGRFVQRIGAEYLHRDVDFEQVGKAFEDLVPADIQNGIDQAKKACIGENGLEIDGLVTTLMLVTAAEIVQRKAEKTGVSEHPDSKAMRRIREAVEAVFEGSVAVK